MYLLLKPHTLRDGVFTDILKEIETEFDIVYLKWFVLSKEQVEALYPHHKDKPYFQRILKSMTSGPCLAVVLKNEAQNDVRALAMRIRQDYPKCENKAENYLHCPDTGMAYKELDMLDVVPTVYNTDDTKTKRVLCL